ncbi:hypothetical protein ENUP19_0253G0025 [Entamoeba nuttalli]
MEQQVFWWISFLWIFNCVKAQDETGCFCIDQRTDGCNECNEGCFKNLGECKKCPDYCISCTSKKTCSRCYEGMMWNGTQCVTCDNYCRKCDNQNYCSECEEGKYLQSGSCSFCNKICDSCDSLNSCTSCNYLEDLVYLNQTCVFCNSIISQCISCLSNIQGEPYCILCKTGYYATEGICQKCDSTCGMSGCYSEGCYDCIDGFVLEEKKCISIDNAHCLKATKSKCEECIDSYHLYNGTCIKIKDSNNEHITVTLNKINLENNLNYLTYQEEEIIFNTPLNLLNGIKDSNSVIPNCLNITIFIDQVICLVCEYGYYPMNSLCLKNQENGHCLIPFNTMNYYEGSSSRCLKCKEGITMINNYCIYVPYCIKYSYEACIECETNYILYNELCFSMNLFYCAETNGVNCTTCIAGYLLNSNSICERSNITNCISYITNSNCCSLCSNNKMISSCECVECNIPHCLTCSGEHDNSCSICEEGYYLTKNKQCQSCADKYLNCLVCNEEGCELCQSPFILNDQKECILCSAIISSCEQCNLNECFECEEGYYLDDSSCKKCEEKVLHCSICDANKCRVCQEGYFLESNQCRRCSEIDGCIECDTMKRWCLKCSSEYYLNTITHLCENCSQKTIGCSKCDASLMCLSCENKEINKANECYVSMNNCIKINELEQCIECEKGYILRNGECKKYENENYCLSYYHDHSFGCEECINSISNSGICSTNDRNESCYFTLNNECIISNSIKYKQPEKCIDTHCIICSSSKECLLCENNYFLNNKFECELIDNCQNNGINQCIQCTSSYYLLESQCKKCQIQHCLECNKNVEEECIQCDNDYILYNNQCVYKKDFHCKTISSSHCISCDSGYFLSTIGVCEKNSQEDCLIQQGSHCVQCKTTNLIHLPNGTSYCSSTERTDNCQIESVFGCQRCNLGYFLYDGQCISCNINCAKCINRLEECIECSFGYLYNSTSRICTTLIEANKGCLHFLPNKKGCAICKKGYYYDKKNYRCNKCDISCLQCNDESSYCITCDGSKGYYKSLDNSCQLVSTILHCKTFEKDHCTSCQNGYYLENNRCLGCQLGCGLCVSNKGCIECLDQYVYRNATQECIYYREISRCIEYSAHKCSKCTEIYTPSTAGDECVYSLTLLAIIGTPSITFVLLFLFALVIIVILILYAHRRDPKKESWECKEIIFEVKESSIHLLKLPESKVLISSLCIDYTNSGTQVISVNERTKMKCFIANKRSKLIQLRYLGIQNDNFEIKVEPSIAALKEGFAVELTISVKPNCSCSFNGLLPFARLNMKTGEMTFFNIPIKFETERTKRLAHNEVSRIKLIGESIFGKTYKANYNGKIVAMKNIKILKQEDDMTEVFLKDVVTFDKCSRGRFITEFIGAIFQLNKLAIVTEYAPLGSLKDLMKEKKSNQVGMELRYKILHDAALGILFLHNKNLMHCDLKPQNILIYSYNSLNETNAKLTDCGFKRSSDMVTSNASFCNKIVNVEYVAPEVLKKDLYLTSADIYSFGMIMFETVHWEPPFPKKLFPYEWTIARFVTEGKRPSFKKQVDNWAVDLIKSCWKQRPFERTHAKNIVSKLESCCIH